MFGIGTTELMVVMVVCVILFGHRLPSMMRGLGQSVSEFQRGVREIPDADDVA